MTIKVSVIVTVLNGENWIDSCLSSIACQTVLQLSEFSIEVCVFDDASVDRTALLMRKWKRKFYKLKIEMKILKNIFGFPKGVGYGRNIAIDNSTGDYLCFQDIDDEMLPERILKQYELTRLNENAIVGSRFVRRPENSTCRFSKWANELNNNKLDVQIFTSHGPTVVMPTWFCHRRVYDNVGGFSERGKGTPEDLIFFYKHLDGGGQILRVDEILLVYTYHPNATTFSISEETIWNIRLKRLIRDVLSKQHWRKGFTIWNAGKQGRRFFRTLPDEFKSNVRAFCDVDTKKIEKHYAYFDEVRRKVTYTVPIVHFTRAKSPLIICMKLDLTNGAFEQNLMSLNLVEGLNYVIFS